MRFRSVFTKVCLFCHIYLTVITFYCRHLMTQVLSEDVALLIHSPVKPAATSLNVMAHKSCSKVLALSKTWQIHKRLVKTWMRIHLIHMKLSHYYCAPLKIMFHQIFVRACITLWHVSGNEVHATPTSCPTQRTSRTASTSLGWNPWRTS